MKWFIAILVLLIVFVALASLQMLPAPIQEPVNGIAAKMFPAKAQMEEKRSDYLDQVEQAAE